VQWRKIQSSYLYLTFLPLLLCFALKDLVSSSVRIVRSSRNLGVQTDQTVFAYM
jgi:hypothetical protein